MSGLFDNVSVRLADELYKRGERDGFKSGFEAGYNAATPDLPVIQA